MQSGSDSPPPSLGLAPPPAARRSSDEDSREEDSRENESSSSPQQPENSSANGQKLPDSHPEDAPRGDSPTSPDVPSTWDLHQNFLKHLTTIALVMAGGIITLLQSNLMEFEPPFVLSFLPPLLSFLLTLAAQWDLVRQAGQGASNVPRSIYWAETVAFGLIGAAIGTTSVFFLIEVGILPVAE